MDSRCTASFLLSILTCLSAAAATTPQKSNAFFYGVVENVDFAHRTFTITAQGCPCLFHYDDQTRISSESGYIRWDKVKPGDGANVWMRVGEGGAGIATRVKFAQDAGADKALALYVARTPAGETLSGVAVSNLLTYEPPPMAWKGGSFGLGTKYGATTGVFHLAIRPDGTVGEITAAKSLGEAKMDLRAAKWLKSWKFRPNSVKDVQIPVTFHWGI